MRADVDGILRFLRALDWAAGIAMIAVGLWLGAPWLAAAGLLGTALAYADAAGRLRRAIGRKLTARRARCSI